MVLWFGVGILDLQQQILRTHHIRGDLFLRRSLVSLFRLQSTGGAMGQEEEEERNSSNNYKNEGTGIFVVNTASIGLGGHECDSVMGDLPRDGNGVNDV